MTVETRNVGSRSAQRGISSLGYFVREHDRDRYQTALFAPAERREAVFALYAFNYELARIRESVSQPILGQIRLQWWRETVEAAYAGAPLRHHLVVEPLAAVIRERGPSRAHFDRIIDARECDFSDEPPATLAALDDYAEGTSATLLELVLEVLDAATPQARAVAREIGTGYALTGLLRAMPVHALTGRCYIPSDIARSVRLDPSTYSALRDTEALRAAVSQIAERAAGRLVVAREAAGALPRRGYAALLPAVIANRFLARLGRMGCNPFAPELAAPDTLQSWRLFAAALRKRL